MEVHHHPRVERKGFKEYFLEFLMIFLAVTLGFFAENIRENITESSRAKEYARLLYDDLKLDTALLHHLADLQLTRSKKLDSLYEILKQGNLQENAKLVYYYGAYMGLENPYIPNDATMQQLRSSGNLRIFKKMELYNAITRYYNICSYYDNIMKARPKMSLSFPAKVYDTYELMGFLAVTPDIRNAVHMSTGNPKLLTTDKQVFNEFSLYVGNEIGTCQISLMLLRSRIEKSLNELLTELENDYNLKSAIERTE